MLIVDTHCDSIDTLERGADCIINPYNMGTQHLQFAALFTDRPELQPEEAWNLLCHMRAQLKDQAVRHADKLSLCSTVTEAEAAVLQGKKALIFSMEGACALNGHPERLEEVAAEGLRCISLTWNQNNLYGCANTFNGTAQDTGLTQAGRELVAECGRRGILLDVSHASDNTCWDILHTSTLPVLASHSDFREVCPHNRNLTREQALAIRDSGGVIGFNLCTSFLGSVHIEKLLDHVEYGLDLVGEDALGFGFDLDGIDLYPSGLTMERSIHEQVVELLARRGYSEQTIRKIAGENYLRVLRSVCP